jgi:hypothetical protein
MTSVLSSAWDLDGLPPGLPWDEFDFAMVESPSEVWFLDRAAVAAEAGRYSRGVAFGARSELRWMKRAGGRFHIVYLSDEGRALQGAMRRAELFPVEAEPRHLLMWGEDDGRIPTTPEYPRGAGPQPGRKAVALRH